MLQRKFRIAVGAWSLEEVSITESSSVEVSLEFMLDDSVSSAASNSS